WGCSPARLRGLAADPAALRAAVDAHIADIMASTAPFGLVEWDVVNENHGNHDLTDILGPDEVARWFRLARQGFPQGGLTYNDFAHLRPGDAGHRAYVEDAVLRLRAAGAPVDGLGIQSHFGGPVPPADVLAELDRLAAKLQVRLAITEFDIESLDGDADLQAAFTRDFLIACFSHPQVDQIIAWGFWERDHWLPSAAMFDRDWTPRPNARAWDALVRGAWWTDVQAATNAEGVCGVRGFKGRHRVTATLDGRSVTAETDIGDAAATVRITL
ncbi:MAG: endo-1,4-beta-xylanase, partial [Planctomycetes bacterium]|nr:endo-1,4-beta-xylanase [Planctomycetota bacterium]